MEVQGAPQNADEHDKSLQQHRQSSSSDNVILEGTLIYRKVGRLKTKNMRMVRELVVLISFVFDVFLFQSVCTRLSLD